MDILFLDEVEDPGSGTASLVADLAGEPGPEAHRRLPASRRIRWPWVVGSVVGVLTFSASLTVPPLIRQAQKDRCLQQIKRIGLALQEFQETNKHFPAAAIVGKDGQRLLSWRVAILPQLGFQSLYDQFHLDEPWASPHNRKLLSEMPTVYACPSLKSADSDTTGYQVVVGPKPELGSIGTAFEWARGVEIREFIDGTSNTVMIVETKRPIPWTQPDDPEFDRDSPTPEFGSGHEGGFHAVFADGSARFLKHTIAPQILRALLTRDGGEVVSS
jgi:hypothetical protein